MYKRYKYASSNDAVAALVSASPVSLPASEQSPSSAIFASCHPIDTFNENLSNNGQAVIFDDAAFIANNSTDIPFFSYYEYHHGEQQENKQVQHLHPHEQQQQQQTIYPSTGIDSMIIGNNIHTKSNDCDNNIALSASLPEGWRMRKRKQSIFEVETNIRTLSELYTSLIKLRDQLPQTITETEEAKFTVSDSNTKSKLTRRSSSIATDTLSVRTNSFSFNSGDSSNVTTPMETDSPLYSSDNSHSAMNIAATSSNSFFRLLSTYPSFIFDLLIQMYLDCLSYKRVGTQKLMEQHRRGELDPAYVCAIYAYAGLHALLCHSDRYGVYSFMNVLVRDAYQVAHEFVEFDSINDTTTVETLVIMHQYLSMTHQSIATDEKTAFGATARHLFSLAKQQMEFILPLTSTATSSVEKGSKKTRSEQEKEQDIYRLLLWMAEIDWSFTVFNNSRSNSTVADLACSDSTITPLIGSGLVSMSLNKLKIASACSNSTVKDAEEKEAERLYIKAMKFRLKGLQILLSLQNRDSNNTNSNKTTEALCHRLNRWRSKYLEWFLYKRHQNEGTDDDNEQQQQQGYTIEDSLALRLHVLYFAGMLELHQHSMLEGFEVDREIWQSKSKWSDYFIAAAVDSDVVVPEQKAALTQQQNKVEKGLYRSMNAAYGFIQVIQLLLEENDLCLLPQIIDTLSAACTVLYFGNKIAVCSPEMVQKSEQALTFVMNAFLKSTTAYESMVECPRIHRFVKKWSPLILNTKKSDY